MMKVNIIIIILIFRTFNCFTQIDNSLLKGIALIEMSKYSEATACLTNYLTLNPQDDEAILYRGIAFMALGNFENAEKDFMLAGQFNNKEAFLQLAISYSKNNDAYAAVQAIEKYIKSNPGVNTIELLKDKEFANIHSSQEWYNFVSGFIHAQKWETISEVDYLVQQGNFEEAHRIIDNATEENLKEAVLYQSKARIYNQANNYTLAIYELNKAKKLEPNNSKILVDLGNLYLKTEKFNQAISSYESAKQSKPEDIHIGYKLATAYQMGGFPEKALIEIEVYLGFFPDNIQASIKQAEILFNLHNYNKTLAILNKYSQSESSNPEWLLLRGKTYYESKTFQSAAYDLSMYLDLDPNSAEANYYLGLTQSNLGNQKLTCYYMKRAFNAGEKRAFKYLKDCE